MVDDAKRQHDDRPAAPYPRKVGRLRLATSAPPRRPRAQVRPDPCAAAERRKIGAFGCGSLSGDAEHVATPPEVIGDCHAPVPPRSCSTAHVRASPTGSARSCNTLRMLPQALALRSPARLRTRMHGASVGQLLAPPQGTTRGRAGKHPVRSRSETRSSIPGGYRTTPTDFAGRQYTRLNSKGVRCGTGISPLACRRTAERPFVLSPRRRRDVACATRDRLRLRRQPRDDHVGDA